MAPAYATTFTSGTWLCDNTGFAKALPIPLHYWIHRGHIMEPVDKIVLAKSRMPQERVNVPMVTGYSVCLLTIHGS